MEDDAERGAQRDALIQLLRRSETRHRRAARMLGLALLLLTGALALLTAAVFGGRARQPPESQVTFDGAALITAQSSWNGLFSSFR